MTGQGRAYVNSIGFDFPEGKYTPGFVVLVTPDGDVRSVACDRTAAAAAAWIFLGARTGEPG